MEKKDRVRSLVTAGAGGVNGFAVMKLGFTEFGVNGPVTWIKGHLRIDQHEHTFCKH